MAVESGYTGTTENEFTIGDGTDGYKYIYAKNSDLNNPGIRWNDDANQWETSNDGLIWASIGGIPESGEYLMLAFSGLSNERVLTEGTGIDFVDAGAGSTLTINIEDTAVIPAAYTNADITIDQQGRIIAAANGVTAASPCPVASVVFVNKSGNDATGEIGNAALPFLTIQAALNVMDDGYVCAVAAGTYNEQLQLPDIESMSLILSAGVTITSSEATTIYRNSSTTLDQLNIQGGTIYNTHGVGTCIAIDGYDGYYGINGQIALQNCTLIQTNDYKAIAMTCVGNLYFQDVRAFSEVDLSEIGKAVLRNLDCDKISPLTYTFNTGAILPSGFAAGKLWVYSGKLGETNINGSLDATFDASTEIGGEFTTTRDSGELILNGTMLLDNLVITDTVAATRNIYNTTITGTTLISMSTTFRSDTFIGEITISDGANSSFYNSIVSQININDANATLYSTLYAGVDRSPGGSGNVIVYTDMQGVDSVSYPIA